MEGFSPTLQCERPEQPGQAKEMISMKVGKKDVSERKGDSVSHHLALCSFAAIEEERFPFTNERDGRDPTLYRGAGRRSAEEPEGKGHAGRNITVMLDAGGVRIGNAPIGGARPMSADSRLEKCGRICCVRKLTHS